MPFRPTLWPTLFTIPALILLLGLGTWQVQRLFEKEAMIAERESRISAAPVELPSPGAAAPEALAPLEFRRAVASGEFLHDKELFVAARTMRGNVGYQIVTPLRLASGGMLLVNRGWVPAAQKNPAKRAEGQVKGPVTVEGAIRLAGHQNWLQHDNEPQNNVWFWFDLHAMADQAGIPAAELVPVFVEAGPAPNPGGIPIGGQTKVALPNDHLQYAMTWYILAVALAVIYVLYHRRPKEAEP